MKKAFAITAAVAAAMTMSSAAVAATDVIATTTADNWSAVTTNGGSEVTVFAPSSIPGTWAPNDANSVWLSPTPVPGNLQAPGQSFPAGELSFIGTYTLSNIADVQTWAITWWADNILRRIIVNGTELTNPALPTGSAQSQQFVGTGISRVFNQSVFVNGTNTIEFVVENGTGSPGNPAGFRLFSTLTTVPEPGTWMLMILGLGAVGFTMRRRQNASVRLQFA